MKNNDDLWDISNRPSTKTKLEILEKAFQISNISLFLLT